MPPLGSAHFDAGSSPVRTQPACTQSRRSPPSIAEMVCRSRVRFAFREQSQNGGMPKKSPPVCMAEASCRKRRTVIAPAARAFWCRKSTSTWRTELLDRKSEDGATPRQVVLDVAHKSRQEYRIWSPCPWRCPPGSQAACRASAPASVTPPKPCSTRQQCRGYGTARGEDCATPTWPGRGQTWGHVRRLERARGIARRTQQCSMVPSRREELVFND